MGDLNLMSIKGKTSAAPPPLMKNAATAEFIYFDNAPLYGIFGMGVEVELTARILTPKSDGTILGEAVCTGHLRCSPQAALTLADSLMKAVEMHRKQLAQQAAEVAREAPADKAA